ncbi:ABC-type branched-chain amino acid transport system, substrate-binding protein [Thermomonospora echinospora]|uniref:ABC-type branched-chain amino acid transport system, substrate-binding protein n=1 Tax=Thermomonospora echinospora TaxID=1992 RepID=A0A1H6E770_9ACTN|nr:ABC transporter substrate-binding protein [Thermomonospora echinospora]SEG93507.1 ABC-type branched-chain amino acid transport system, substrate-binding protein [Thermomonospora echinospora]
MTPRPKLMLAAALGAAGLLTTACGGSAVSDSSNASGQGSGLARGCPDNGTTGLTDTTIKLGLSQPLSGPYVSVGGQLYGMQAYFAYVNSQGGIQGPDGRKRKVELVYKDDAYTATKAKANVDQLVNRDKVFALLGQFGTAGNLAARPIIAQQCVPSLFATTGAPELANPKYPWAIAGSISYATEGRILGQYVRDKHPNATVAVLEQDDDLGRAYLQGFEQAIAGSGVKVVATQTFEAGEPDVKNQITTLAATKADLYFNVASGLTGLQALNHVHASGWRPEVIQVAQLPVTLLRRLQPGAGDRLITGGTGPDFANPEVAAGNEEFQLYMQWFRKTPGADKIDPLSASQGWFQGRLLDWTVRHATTMDRVGVMESARSIDYTGPSFTLPGIKIHTTPDDPHLFEGMQLNRFDAAKGRLVPLGEVIDIDGQVKYEPVS